MRQCQTANIWTLRPWYLRFVWQKSAIQVEKRATKNANTLKKKSRWMFSTMNLLVLWILLVGIPVMLSFRWLKLPFWALLLGTRTLTKTSSSSHRRLQFFPFFQHLRLSGLPSIYGTCPKAGKDDFYACQTDQREKSGLSSLSGDGWRWIKWDRLLSFYAWEVLS